MRHYHARMILTNHRIALPVTHLCLRIGDRRTLFNLYLAYDPTPFTFDSTTPLMVTQRCQRQCA